MSEEIKFKDLILFLSAIALVLFYLLYMPWTALSAFTTATDPTLWLYYFTLVLGLLFPLYYAIGREDMAWYVLGLSIIINSIILILEGGLWVASGAMALIVGVLFFLTPILEKMMADMWDKMLKNIFHILKGLFMILAVALYANFVMDDMVDANSFNHAMPQFLFMGGGLFVVFGATLFLYGLFKLLADFMPDSMSKYMKDLAGIFYMLMVLVFLLGITYNVTYNFPGTPPWGVSSFPTSIQFFADLFAVGLGNLGAILLIILYIYGMHKIAEKFSKMEEAPAATQPEY